MVVEGTCASVPARERIVSFGRYKGKLLGSLPSGYLRWIASKKSLREGHWTIWAELAEDLLHERASSETAVSTTEGLDHQDSEGQVTIFADLVNIASWKEGLGPIDLHRNRLNSAAYASLLRWCGNVKALSNGKLVHHHIVKSGLQRDIYLGSLIVQMYGDCGALGDARAFFATMYHRNVFSWNFMIRAYVQHGQRQEAFHLFEQMPNEEALPDRVTFLSILSACDHQSTLPQGKMIHHLILGSDFTSDALVGNAIISMYGKCGCLDDAQKTFDQMFKDDVITWNAVIAAFGQNGLGQQALLFFYQMQQEGVIPNLITYVSMLDACACEAALSEGQCVHMYVLFSHVESNVVVGTALVNMYGKCGKSEDARRIFDKITGRNVVTWTAMISAYAQNERGKDALQLFTLMEQGKVVPTKLTYISILDACASYGSLSIGEQMVTRIKTSEIAVDVVIGTALINMYGKCGGLVNARRIFDKLPIRDVASWNAMMAVYAQHGQDRSVLHLFDQMRGEVSPDKVTYISVLCVCSHCGLTDEGSQLFLSMNQDHGIIPAEDHYNCMIDLFGRAGKLDEAEELVNRMPFGPSVVSVMSLLGACRYQADVKRGERVAEHAFRLVPDSASPYIMLSNIYAAAGMEEDASKVISRMRKKGLK